MWYYFFVFIWVLGFWYLTSWYLQIELAVLHRLNVSPRFGAFMKEVKIDGKR